MTNMTPQELSKKVAEGVPYPVLREWMTPLLRRFTYRRPPGLEYEDVYQELCIELWRCQRAYDPSRGSFMTLLWQAFSNRLGKLAGAQRKGWVITDLECQSCGHKIQPRARGSKCPGCKQVSWRPNHNRYGIRSLDAITLDAPAFDVEDDAVNIAQDVENKELIAQVLNRANPSQRRIVDRILSGDNISARDRRSLKGLLD